MIQTLALLSIILGVAGSAWAQTPDTSTLAGRVEDANRLGISGASVTVRNAESGLRRTAETDGSGRFSISGLPIAGTYAVRVVKSGFAEAQIASIELAGGGDANLQIQLSVAAEKTSVTVTGAAGDVRTDSPELGDRLSARQMEETPLPNQRISYLPLLNAANRPALNQGDVFLNQNLFTTNDSGRRQTWFEVDGAAGIDSWGRQALFTNIPLAALQEMTVIGNGFSAEYGFGLGGVVNIVTKSGGPNFHGEFQGLWRPSAPEAKLSGFTSRNAASGNDVTNDTLGLESASVSGPLGSGKTTQFFAAGEASRQDRASPVTSVLAPQNFIGKYRGWLGFLRVDHQVNARNNLFLRSNVDHFYDSNPGGVVGGNNLPSVDRIFRRRTYTQELGETAVLSSRLVNNLRLQFQLASPITQFDPVIDGTQFVVPIASGGTFTSGTSQSALLMNRQYELNDTLANAFGRHQINYGTEILHAHSGGNSKEYGGPTYLGQFVYKPCGAAASFCEGPYLSNIQNVERYTQSYGNANYVVDDTLWAVFVQDNFRATDFLTLNFGLRYEQQTFADARANVAPRVGFAYDVGGQGKMAIHGGFGIYYAQIVDNSEANYVLGGPTGVFNYTAGPGQVGFPVSVQSAPLPAFPAGAAMPVRSLYIRPGRSGYLDQFFPTSTLRGYPNKLLDPSNRQWVLGFERQLGRAWVLNMDYIGSHTVNNVRPLDVDAPAPYVRTAQGESRSAQAANCTRPYWIEWYQQHSMTCSLTTASNPQPPYSVIQSDVNDGYAFYNALDVNLRHRFRDRFAMLASYTWSHAIDNVDPDVPGQSPNDPNFTGNAERGNAIFDQRHRLVLSGSYVAPWKIAAGGIATLASGVPFNVITGSSNSGDLGATTDRPDVHGAVVGRNTGRGRAIYDVDPFMEKMFAVRQKLQMTLRVEVFNVLNHANFIGYSGTYGNGVKPLPGFGAPLQGVANQLPARSIQFSTKANF